MSRVRSHGVAVFVLAIVVAAFAGVRADDGALAKVIEPYLRIQGQLAQDSIDGVAQAAAEIERNAAVLGAAGSAVAAHAGSLAKAGDLKAARAAFGPLSDVLVGEFEKRQASVPGVQAMYCPMVNKPWLQRGGAVRNPYYGKSMLTCGEPKKSAATPEP